MSDFLRIITHSRRFKSAVKELDIQQLEDVKAKLEGIIAERHSEEEMERQEQEQRISKIQKYREMIAADGIDPGELQAAIQEKSSKRSPRKAKYEIWNEKGERITWTGQGRMPNFLKARIEAGESLDTFLIE